MRNFCAIACLLFLLGCASSRLATTNAAIFENHPQPIKIFSIGYWKKGYVVLTLTDANKNYFVMIIRHNDSLRKGAVYR